MKKVFFLVLVFITILSSKAQGLTQNKSTDTIKPKASIAYWNHNEFWINRNAAGINIINGLSINNKNFIGIGIGTSMNGITLRGTKFLTFGIRYEHDFMTKSKVSPFLYTNAGMEFGYGPRFVMREINLTNSIGTGVKFHTKRATTFGLAFEIKHTYNLYREQAEFKSSPIMMPILKFFVSFGGTSKATKQAENLKTFY